MPVAQIDENELNATAPQPTATTGKNATIDERELYDPTFFDSLGAAQNKFVRSAVAGTLSAPVEIGNMIGNLTEWGAGGFQSDYKYKNAYDNPYIGAWSFQNFANMGEAAGVLPEDRVPEARNTLESYMFPGAELTGAALSGPAGLVRKGSAMALTRAATRAPAVAARTAHVAPEVAARYAERMAAKADLARREFTGTAAAVGTSAAGVGYARENYPDQPIYQIIGGLIGAGTPTGIRAVGQVTRGVLRGGARNAAAMREAEAAAQRQGIDTTLPAMQAPGFNFENLLEGTVAGRMPGGQGTIRNAVRDMGEQASERVDDFGRQQYGHVPTDADAGAVISGAIRRSINTYRQTADQMEGAMRQAAPKEPMPVTHTVEALRKLREVAASDPDIQAIVSNPTVNRLWQAIMEREPNARIPAGATTFDALYAARKDIGEQMGQVLQLEKGASSGAVKYLYGAMARDLQRMADRTPGQVQFVHGGRARSLPVGRAWKFMKRYEERGQSRIRDTLQPLVSSRSGRVNPGAVFSDFNRMGLGDMRRVIKTMRPEEHVQVASQIIRQMGKAEGAEGFNLSSFASAARSAKTSGRLAIALSGPHMREVRQIVADLRLLGEGRKRFGAFSHDVSGMTATTGVGLAGIGGAIASGNIPLAVGIFTSLYAAPWAVAKIVTNPRYRQWLSNTRSLKPTLKNSQKAMAALVRTIATDPSAERQKAGIEVLAHLRSAFINGDAIDKAAILPIPGVQEVAGLAQSIRGMARGDIPIDAENVWTAIVGASTLGPSAHTLGAVGAAGAGAMSHAMFIGGLAKKAPRHTLEWAKKAEAAGVSMREIHKKSNWHKSADGQWKFEISDKDASLRPNAFSKIFGGGRQGNETTLDQVLTHNEIEDNYPGLLKGIRVKFGTFDIPKDLNALQVEMTPRGAVIHTNLSTFLEFNKAMRERDGAKATQIKKEFLSGMLHEVQHVVQMREGFAQGGSPMEPNIVTAVNKTIAKLHKPEIDRVDAIKKKVLDDYNAYVDRAIEAKVGGVHEKVRYFDHVPNSFFDRWMNDNPSVQMELDIIVPKIRDAQKVYRYQAYRHLLGEVEARVTQRSKDMTVEQRMESYPADRMARDVDPGMQGEPDLKTYPKLLIIKKDDPATMDRPVYKPGEMQMSLSREGFNANERLRRHNVGGVKGKYIGAPRWAKTPRQLGKVRTDYYNHVKEGLQGRDWYDIAGKALGEYAGNKADARKLTGAMAVTSANTQLGGNTTFAARAHAQAKAGDPIRSGRFPENMGKDLEAIYRGGEKATGLKRGPYEENLAVAGGYGKHAAQARPVNDMWQMLAMGYENGEITGGAATSAHRFMDRTTHWAIAKANREKLGGYNNWDVKKLQAAAWVGVRIAKGDLAPADAAVTYLDYLKRMEGQLSRDASDQKLFTDPKGRDKIAQGFGMLQPNKSVQGGTVKAVLPEKTGGGGIDPSAKKLARAVQATYGLLTAKDAVTFHRKLHSVPKDAGMSVDVNVGRMVSNDDLMKALPELQKFGDGIAPVPTENGFRILYFGGDGGRFRRFAKEIEGKLGGKAEVGRFDADTLKNDWAKNKLGQSYVKEFTTPELRASFDGIAPEIARDLMKLSEKTKQQVAPGVAAMRKAVAKGGIKELEKLIASGAFPAILAAIVAPFVMRSEHATEDQET